VRRPWESTERASLRASELARSTFAGDTARMTLEGRNINLVDREGKEPTC